MKKLVGLVFVVLFSFISLAYAEEAVKVEINKYGTVRVVEVSEDAWQVLTDAEMTAYKNPGTEVPVDSKVVVPKRVDFFHYVPVEKYSKVVVYNNGKMKTLEKTGEKQGEQRFAWYVVLLLVSAFCMALSNIAAIAVWKRKKAGEKQLGFASASAVATAFAAAFVFVAAAAAAFVFVAAAAVAFVVSAFVATFVAAVVDNRSEKTYIVCVAIYYSAIIIALIV